MNFLPESVSRLIDELSKLPGIGPKSAQRLAFHILKGSEGNLQGLGEAVLKAKDGVMRCEKCSALASEKMCGVCSDPGRDAEVICVVESTMDMVAIEKTGEFKGLYHVLMGKISPLDGVGPDDLRIAELFERVTDEAAGVKEVILALNPDLEGDTTALFLQKKLASLSPVSVSRIARGIPSGGNLEYTDDATLIRALQGRQVLSS
jgi:recombination protein RecR